MDKFVRNVGISMQQAYGNITIKVPQIDDSLRIEVICKDKPLMDELANAVEQWTVTIKQTIENENARPKENKSAQGETEYWRQRSASFNTLYQ